VSKGEQKLEWESGWDAHERAQRQRLAKLPLDEKLRWLEEAHDLVRHLSRHGPETDRPVRHSSQVETPKRSGP